MVNHNGYNDMASIQNNLDDILYMDAQMIRCLFCLAFFLFVFFFFMIAVQCSNLLKYLN